MKTTTTGRNNGIQWTLWMQLDDLDFADDLALLSHNHSQMQDKTTRLETVSAGTGLKISRKKPEMMKINSTANTPVTGGGEPIREVDSFFYLGSAIGGHGQRCHSQDRQSKGSLCRAQEHLGLQRSAPEPNFPSSAPT